MTKTKAQVAAAREDHDLARANLLRYMEQRPEIRCVVTHVSRSGMQRVIMPLVAIVDDDGQPSIIDVTWDVSRLIGWRCHQRERGVIVDGCGMDMCFHLVYTVSAELYGHADQGGYKIKSRPIG